MEGNRTKAFRSAFSRQFHLVRSPRTIYHSTDSNTLPWQLRGSINWHMRAVSLGTVMSCLKCLTFPSSDSISLLKAMGYSVLVDKRNDLTFSITAISPLAGTNLGRNV